MSAALEQPTYRIVPGDVSHLKAITTIREEGWIEQALEAGMSRAEAEDRASILWGDELQEKKGSSLQRSMTEAGSRREHWDVVLASFGVERPETVVGFSQVDKVPTDGEVPEYLKSHLPPAEYVSGYMNKNHRNQGYGRLLIIRAFGWLREEPAVPQVHLSVDMCNVRVQRLYRDLGFVMGGPDPRYVARGWQTVVATCDLPTTSLIERRAA